MKKRKFSIKFRVNYYTLAVTAVGIAILGLSYFGVIPYLSKSGAALLIYLLFAAFYVFKGIRVIFKKASSLEQDESTVNGTIVLIFGIIWLSLGVSFLVRVLHHVIVYFMSNR